MKNSIISVSIIGMTLIALTINYSKSHIVNAPYYLSNVEALAQIIENQEDLAVIKMEYYEPYYNVIDSLGEDGSHNIIYKPWYVKHIINCDTPEGVEPQTPCKKGSDMHTFDKNMYFCPLYR